MEDSDSESGGTLHDAAMSIPGYQAHDVDRVAAAAQTAAERALAASASSCSAAPAPRALGALSLDDEPCTAMEVGVLAPAAAAAGPTAEVAAAAAAAGFRFPLTPVEPLSPPAERNEAASPDISQAAWLQAFTLWPERLQKSALDELVSTLAMTSSGAALLLHLNLIIQPHLQRDFISDLPQEIALHILSFLDGVALCRICEVSHMWRATAMNECLWRDLCRQEAVSDAILPAMRQHFSQATFTWKQFYVTKRRVERAWRSAQLPKPAELIAHKGHVITCLVVLDDGRIVSGSDDQTLNVWDSLQKEPLHTLVGHQGGVWCCAVQDDHIVSGSTDRTLRVWRLSSGEWLRTLSGHASTVRCVRIFGNHIVSGSRDSTVNLWDLNTGNLLFTFNGHTEAVRCVEFDGKYIVSGSYDGTVRVWDANVYECLHVLKGHTSRVYSLQFDGQTIVSGSLDMTIRVWDLLTGECQHVLRGHQSLTGLMELRDNILVSGNVDTNLRIWDLNTGLCLHTLRGHGSAVTCLTFTSKYVTSCSDDGTVKLWDIKTGEFIRDLVDLNKEYRARRANGADVPPDNEGPFVVWRVQCTETQMICAVGHRDSLGDETKILVLDFLDASGAVLDT